MDPNLFRIDWERLTEVLVTIVVLSFFLERALALVFESRVFLDKCSGKNLKEILAFALCAGVCWKWDFDALSIVLLKPQVEVFGMLLTGAIIAGGSKASIKLFQDVLGFKSAAVKEREVKARAGAAGAGGPTG